MFILKYLLHKNVITIKSQAMSDFFVVKSNNGNTGILLVL